MAFGQSAGPPAHGKQLSELLGLLEEAGHADFRDARGPMGFNQRQASGKFTREEADAFIEQLQMQLADPNELPQTSKKGEAEPPTSRPAAEPRPRTSPPARPATGKMTMSQVLRKASDNDLAAELQRRGWAVMEP